MHLFFKIILKKPFELQIWLVVCAIAGIRTIMGLFQDFSQDPIFLYEVILDLLFLSFFSTLFLLIYIGFITRISVLASMLLIGLGAANFIQFGGAEGASEYNFMAIGLALVLVNHKKWLIPVSLLYLLVMTVIILDIHNEGILSQLLFIHFSSSHDDFIFTSLALMSVMIFFKWALVKENDRLKRLRKLVKKHFRAIQNQNKGLLRQKKELEKLNLKLEKEIRHHTRHIVKKNEAINEYMRLTSESFSEPLQNILSKTEHLNPERSPYDGFLYDSIIELNEVITKAKEEINEIS